MTAAAMSLDFTLPPELEAREPAELRGAGRDDVRMLVNRHRMPVATLLPSDLTPDAPTLVAPSKAVRSSTSGVPDGHYRMYRERS